MVGDDYSYGGADTDEDVRSPVYEDEAPTGGQDTEDWRYGEDGGRGGGLPYDIEDADDSLMKCAVSSASFRTRGCLRTRSSPPPPPMCRASLSSLARMFAQNMFAHGCCLHVHVSIAFQGWKATPLYPHQTALHHRRHLWGSTRGNNRRGRSTTRRTSRTWHR